MSRAFCFRRYSAVFGLAAVAVAASVIQPPPAKLYFELPSNRVLDMPELTAVFADADVTITRADEEARFEWHEMRSSVRAGHPGHVHIYAIPALLAILRDPSERGRTRWFGVLALSRIADKRVVDYLLDLLTDSDPNIADQAASQIERLTGKSFQFSAFKETDLNALAPRDVVEASAKEIRDWWRSNRDRVTLNTAATFFID